MTKEELAKMCFMTYGEMLEDVCTMKKHRPSILAGIMMRESECGTSPLLTKPGPEGIGDGGKAYGLFQLDIRWHKPFIDSGHWMDPTAACIYACDLLTSNLNALQILSAKGDLPWFDMMRGAIAAYNCGVNAVIWSKRNREDIDFRTTGRDYSGDVIQNVLIYQNIKPKPVTGVVPAL